MPYYTATYSNKWNFCKSKQNLIIKFPNGFSIYKNECTKCPTYFLFYKSYKISELHNGAEAIITKYKGDYIKWINAIYKKDMKKINVIKQNIKFLQKDIISIKSIWKKAGILKEK